jgi:hypothetical protein
MIKDNSQLIVDSADVRGSGSTPMGFSGGVLLGFTMLLVLNPCMRAIC